MRSPDFVWLSRPQQRARIVAAVAEGRQFSEAEARWDNQNTEGPTAMRWWARRWGVSVEQATRLVLGGGYEAEIPVEYLGQRRRSRG